MVLHRPLLCLLHTRYNVESLRPNFVTTELVSLLGLKSRTVCGCLCWMSTGRENSLMFHVKKTHTNKWEHRTPNVSRRGRGKLYPPGAVSPQDGTTMSNGSDFIAGTGRQFVGVTAGRDGNFSVSRRDGTVIVRCHGGTER